MHRGIRDTARRARPTGTKRMLGLYLECPGNLGGVHRGMTDAQGKLEPFCIRARKFSRFHEDLLIKRTGGRWCAVMAPRIADSSVNGEAWPRRGGLAGRLLLSCESLNFGPGGP